MLIYLRPNSLNNHLKKAVPRQRGQAAVRMYYTM